MYNEYKIIALCISRVHTKINLSLVDALNRKLVPLNYRLLIFHTSTDLYRGTLNDTGEKTIFDLIPYHMVDAVVIHDESFYDKWSIQNIIDQCYFNQIPVISIGAKHEHSYNITYQYKDGFRMIVEHLLTDHQVKDVRFIAALPDTEFSNERLDACREAMAAHGLSLSDDQIYYGELWEDPTREAANAIIASGNIPDAIVCVNDYTAITICETFKRHGYKIPEDVIVTGFDGVDAAAYCTPSITTCGYDVDRMSDMIIQIIQNTENQTTSPFVNKIPFSIRHGATCGCGVNIRYEELGDLFKSADDRLNGYIDFEGHLYELGEKLILCQTQEEQYEYLKALRINNCSIMLNKDYLDPSVNLIETFRDFPFDKEMLVIYQSGIRDDKKASYVKLHELVPGLEDLMELKRPILFNALSYLGKPIGYLCMYHEPIINEYCHIVQYVTMLNQAFGGSHNVSYLNHMAHYLEDLSDRDFLTKLYNRMGFYKKLPSFLDNATESDNIMIASIDLDGLKFINDHYGHASGDEAIKLVAQAIDMIPITHKIAARFGGDEFALVAIPTIEMDIQGIVNSLNMNIDILSEMAKKPYSICTSFGSVLTNRSEFDFEEMFRQSDEKMYQIKKAKPHSRR